MPLVHTEVVPEPFQGQLVDCFCHPCGDSRGPLVVRMPQEVEDDFVVHRVDPRSVSALLQGEGGGQPRPVGHCAQDGR